MTATQRRTRMVVLENFGSCNMRCAYCFPEHMWSREGHTGRMSSETLRQTLERAFDTPSPEPVELHLAGGEPLLAGRDWLEEAFAVAREIARRHGKGVSFSMQSNATMVTPELARFLADNQVTIGVSLDGDEDINEATRGHTADTLRGLRLLTEAFGRPPGVIVTVTRANALRMDEVIAHLDGLGIAMFRANQMGATASWNVASAPRAEEWAATRAAVVQGVVDRRGRIMEFNADREIGKFVGALLGGVDPFSGSHGCCAARCPAGSELIYFDRRGDAYPCPRSTVTPAARTAHASDDDFERRWQEMLAGLDDAMAVPDECASCPAQVVCDYGCHAFNIAEGNFFEVNCDASKTVYGWASEHLEMVARFYLLAQWRTQQRVSGGYLASRAGVDLPARQVTALTTSLERALDRHRAAPGLDPGGLDRRYGWRADLVPTLPITRRRVAAVGTP